MAVVPENPNGQQQQQQQEKELVPEQENENKEKKKDQLSGPEKEVEGVKKENTETEEAIGKIFCISFDCSKCMFCNFYSGNFRNNSIEK